jgi:Flp pilus assembly CpaF family ATPase
MAEKYQRPERVELTWTDENVRHVRAALGAEVLALIYDPTISEILLRGEWCAIERFKTGFEVAPGLITAQNIARALTVLAPALNKELSLADPEIEITLRLTDDGPRIRFTGVYAGPAGLDSILTLRIARAVNTTWDEAVESGVISLQVSQALLAQLSLPIPTGILIAGPVGAGKTTMLRIIADKMMSLGRPEHFVIVEDAHELDFGKRPLVTNLLTTQFFTFYRAIRASKRHRPTRLIVGEFLGGEALDATKAGANGAGLLATIHGKTAAAAIRNLQGYMAEGAGNVPVNPEIITDAFKIVIVMARTLKGFKIREAAYIDSASPLQLTSLLQGSPA